MNMAYCEKEEYREQETENKVSHGAKFCRYVSVKLLPVLISWTKQ